MIAIRGGIADQRGDARVRERYPERKEQHQCGEQHDVVNERHERKTGDQRRQADVGHPAIAQARGDASDHDDVHEDVEDCEDRKEIIGLRQRESELALQIEREDRKPAVERQRDRELLPEDAAEARFAEARQERRDREAVLIVAFARGIPGA